jgi:acyl-CoA hydrolase
MGVLAAIAERQDKFEDLEIVCAYLIDRPDILDHLDGPFSWRSMQPSGATRDVADHPSFRNVPGRYSDLDGITAPDGALPIDALIVQVSPLDAQGRMSLGTSAGGSVGVLQTAPIVIGQINPNMPYVFGDGETTRDAFDLLIDLEEPLATLTPAPRDDLSSTIAAHVAPFIRDGATLQFGIGAVPDAVLSSLLDRSDLGLHGGMINDACVALIESGVVTNTHKGLDEGVSVAAEVMGSTELYEWCHRNPLVRTVRGGHSHGIAGIGRVRNFVALQSTVEVALDGSANSEFAAGRVISGPGGAPDFAFGASISQGGRGIVALPSTAARGKISRIVRRVAEGAPTTLSSYLADIVVTEFGAVELRGRSVGERAELLRAIAHPDFRDSLA